MTNKRKVVFSGLFVGLMLMSFAAWAINTSDSGFLVGKGGTETINAHGETRRVTNLSASDNYFVPTKSVTEWTTFRTAAGSISDLTMCSPVNGGWSAWSAYGECSKPCDGGKKFRTRTCSNPAPSCGGTTCAGSTSENTSCNPQACASCTSGGDPAYCSGSYSVTTTTSGKCEGTVTGSTGPYEGQSCTQFTTSGSCMQGWDTHGCHWDNSGTTTTNTYSCSSKAQSSCQSTSGCTWHAATTGDSCATDYNCVSGSCELRACTASDWNAAPSCASCYTTSSTKTGTKKSGANCTGGVATPTRSCTATKECCSDSNCGSGKECNSSGVCVSSCSANQGLACGGTDCKNAGTYDCAGTCQGVTNKSAGSSCDSYGGCSNGFCNYCYDQEPCPAAKNWSPSLGACTTRTDVEVCPNDVVDDPTPSTCFVAGTKVLLANGYEKNIEDVMIGEVVKGSNGAENKVLGFDRPLLGGKNLYSFNGGNYFVTHEHPFMTTEGWKSINPEATKDEVPDLEVNELKEGDTLITTDGEVLLETIEMKSADAETPLYNFMLDGNSEYYADGYLVHNKNAPIACGHCCEDNGNGICVLTQSDDCHDIQGVCGR